MSTTIESLELEIHSNSTSAVQGIDALTQSLAKLKGATKGGLGLSSVSKEMGKVSEATNRVSHSNSKASASFTNLYYKIKTVALGFKKIGEVIYSAIEKSSDYVENVNLFTVSMGSYADEAKRYAESVGEVMGIDPGEWMRNQGVFMTLATGFGVASDRAAVMSKNLTQLGYDLSSFFNISYEDAMQKLQSGLAGELEPLRRIGYDLSQTKLEATALELGIDKSVSSMTQAEKAQLRYYAIMTQVTTAHGDMARTLEAPANQMKVLRAQIEMAAREIGNIFIPALNAVLPYAIAVVKVIRTLASTIASLVGYELPEVDYSGVSSMSGVAEDTSDAMDEATKSAKKLKSYMLGFDELNVINPSDDSSSDLSDISSGFDFELPEYDFLEALSEHKISAITEEMKEWLGITGEISSWGELFETRLGKILIAVGAIGAALLLWKIGKGFVGAFSALGTLFGAGGIGNIGKSKAASTITSPKTILKGLANVALIVGGVIALVTAVGLLTKIPGFNETLEGGLSALGTVFEELVPILIPIALVSAGMVVIGKVKVSQVSKGLANAAIIIGGTTVVITAIGALLSIPYFTDFLSTGITSVVDTFNGLYDIAVPIGLLSAYLVAIKMISPSTILTGLAGFALVIGGTVALITAIGALLSIPYFSDFLSTGITSVVDTFDGLYSIAVPIGVLSAYLVAIKLISPATFASGLAGFAIVIGGTMALITAIGALLSIPELSDFLSTGITSLKDMFDGLHDIAVPIGVLSAYLITLGLVTPTTILSGLAGFALVIGGFSAILVALGALKKETDFEWLVDEGADIILKLGNTLGKFAGCIVGGFAEGQALQ